MTITITKDDVTAVAGELAGTALSDAQWTLVLEMTNEELNVAAFPSTAKAMIAARYLAAHKAVKMKAAMVAGSAVGGAAGPLASVTVGAVSKTFRTSPAQDSVSSAGVEFTTTAPGREYLRLVRTWCPRMILAQ